MEFLHQYNLTTEEWPEAVEGYIYPYCNVHGIQTTPISTEQVKQLLKHNGVDLRLAFLVDGNALFLSREGLQMVGGQNSPRWKEAIVAYFTVSPSSRVQ